MTLAQVLQRAEVLRAEMRLYYAENEALFSHERRAASMRALYYAQRMRMDIGLIGKLTDAELFDRRPVVHQPVPDKIMLYTGAYPKGHPYLSMTIDQLLDQDFVRANQAHIPSCWQKREDMF